MLASIDYEYFNENLLPIMSLSADLTNPKLKYNIMYNTQNSRMAIWFHV